MNKEVLKQQIEEMKAKLADMEAELNKPKGFEWKYTHNRAFVVISYDICDNMSGVDTDYLCHGRYRTTQENAERALERNRLANRLEALAEQLDPDWVVDWENGMQEKWYVYYIRGEYKYSCMGGVQHIGQVYMSKATAAKIVDMLNSKGIEL